MATATILVIDDEPDVIELLRYNLEREGFDVLAATDGEAGLQVALQHLPDLIVLDLMMAGMDGLEVCRRVRAESRTARMPILMLTAKASEPDRVVGLEFGADDYVVKPFSPRELVARVKALLRRSAFREAPEDTLRHGALAIHRSRREVTREGKPITLTATEFRILEFLAARPGRVFSRMEIIDGALGRDVAVLDRTVDVHVTALRRKLAAAADVIETVRGFGYRFRE